MRFNPSHFHLHIGHIHHANCKLFSIVPRIAQNFYIAIKTTGDGKSFLRLLMWFFRRIDIEADWWLKLRHFLHIDATSHKNCASDPIYQSVWGHVHISFIMLSSCRCLNAQVPFSLVIWMVILSYFRLTWGKKSSNDWLFSFGSRQTGILELEIIWTLLFFFFFIKKKDKEKRVR